VKEFLPKEGAKHSLNPATAATEAGVPKTQDSRKGNGKAPTIEVGTSGRHQGKAK